MNHESEAIDHNDDHKAFRPSSGGLNNDKVFQSTMLVK